MKTRLSNSEVGHAWYYNTDETTQDIGAENFFYSGDTIYSYGSHYPIAKKFGDVILFTNDGHFESSYGPTTSRHVSLTRRAIPSSAIVFYVNDTTPRSKQDHVYNYEHNFKLLEQTIKDISKGRNNTWAQDQRYTRANELIEQLNGYTKHFKLGKRQIDPTTILDPEAIKRQAIKEKAAAKAKANKLRKQHAQLILDWKNNETNHISYSIQDCYLRLSKDQTHIETSQGATLKLKRAQHLYAYVQAILSNALEFKPLSFGSFELTKVTDKEITIGCHRIAVSELDRVNNTIPA